MRRRRRNMIEWPAWRFSPDGESQLFEKAEDVPEGWTSKPPSVIYEAPAQSAKINKEDVIKQLQDFSVDIDPRWGLAKMKEVLKELIND